MSNPMVTITMENGQVMTGELYPDKAPNTVNNFIALANSGFYDIEEIMEVSGIGEKTFQKLEPYIIAE